jgi:vacuolar protein sorting-associated protein 54
MPIDPTALLEDLSDILSSATELGNARMGKVVLTRSEQHTGLELLDFMTFFQESWDFVVRCEVICRRMIVGLRGVIVSQVGRWIVHHYILTLTEKHVGKVVLAGIPPNPHISVR